MIWVNDTCAIAAVENQGILKTWDSGDTWTPVSLPNINGLGRIQIAGQSMSQTGIETPFMQLEPSICIQISWVFGNRQTVGNLERKSPMSQAQFAWILQLEWTMLAKRLGLTIEVDPNDLTCSWVV